MDSEKQRKQDQLEEHSLPGTNQAGEGPGDCDDDREVTQAGELPATQPEPQPRSGATRKHDGTRN